MKYQPLTTEQVLARKKLIEGFRRAIIAAIWTEIEVVDQSLLCANDGVPYSQLQFSLRRNELESLVENSADAACGRMAAWL